jgi:hypothetical protein
LSDDGILRGRGRHGMSGNRELDKKGQSWWRSLKRLRTPVILKRGWKRVMTLQHLMGKSPRVIFGATTIFSTNGKRDATVSSYRTSAPFEGCHRSPRPTPNYVYHIQELDQSGWLTKLLGKTSLACQNYLYFTCGTCQVTEICHTLSLWLMRWGSQPQLSSFVSRKVLDFLNPW